jgi:hypothetical protein
MNGFRLRRWYVCGAVAVVETRHALSLRHAQPTNPFAKLFDTLNQGTDETTSSFFLKKKYPIWKK